MAEAIVVGAGPNGLAAAVTLARAGISVDLYEAKESIGGGTRTEELIEPGHLHDICSAVHPMAFASPFFRDFGLSERLEWFIPELSFGHPLDHGRAALAYRDLERTASSLGRDGELYRRVFSTLSKHSEDVINLALNPLLRPAGQLLSRIPALLALGLGTIWQAGPLWNLGFRDDLAPAMLSGVAAHTVGRMPSFGSAAAGLVLQHLAHTVGWPIPRGGSAEISRVLMDDFRAHGGTVHLNEPIEGLAQFSTAKTVLLDVAPSALLAMSGKELPSRYASALKRFRYNNAACKVDFILSDPVPWTHPELNDAGTVHTVGSRRDAAQAEAAVAAGKHPERPYVLLSQPSRFDSSRAPGARQIVWTYCHVPAGSTRDMTAAITAQIERFAPGFSDTVIASQVTTAAELGGYNANYPGGDFGTGLVNIRQLVARPIFSPTPWRTPLPGVYLCSAGTTPGPGVHGMAGAQAANLALKEVFGLAAPTLSPGT